MFDLEQGLEPAEYEYYDPAHDYTEPSAFTPSFLGQTYSDKSVMVTELSRKDEVMVVSSTVSDILSDSKESQGTQSLFTAVTGFADNDEIESAISDDSTDYGSGYKTFYEIEYEYSDEPELGITFDAGGSTTETYVSIPDDKSVSMNYELRGIRRLPFYEIHDFVNADGEEGAIIFKARRLHEPPVSAAIEILVEASEEATEAVASTVSGGVVESDSSAYDSESYQGDYPLINDDVISEVSAVTGENSTEMIATSFMEEQRIPPAVWIVAGMWKIIYNFSP